MADAGIASAVDSLLGNRYMREARLAPAFLSFFPILLVMMTWIHGFRGVIPDVVALLALFGVVRWMSHLWREAGDRLDNELMQKWGGKPTTTLLRQSRGFEPIAPKALGPEVRLFLDDALPESVIEDEIKKRRGPSLPSRDDDKAKLQLTENKRARALDHLYEPVFAWLRENTRHGLVFEENISYGFQRNLYALRWVAIASCLSGLGIHIFAIWWTRDCWFPYTSPLNWAVTFALLVYLILAVFFVREKQVKLQAFTYARQLILAVFSLPIPEAGPRNDRTRVSFIPTRSKK
jgi:hypothetical protein